MPLKVFAKPNAGTSARAGNRDEDEDEEEEEHDYDYEYEYELEREENGAFSLHQGLINSGHGMEAPTQPRSSETTRQQRWIWMTVIGLLVLTGMVEWWLQRRKESRYDEQILRVARRYAVDPALVKAVVWRESKFNPRARGRVGEIGLMQIRSLAAQEWAQAQAPPRSFEGNLFEPETNLVVGAWYLSKLVKRYSRTDNAIPYALADFNAGRANVLRWLTGPAQTNSVVFVSQIGFPGTQDYVRSIVLRSIRYQRSFEEMSKPKR